MASQRRNHYIPRFLLNGFCSRREGRKRWIWQFPKGEQPREISTRDAAVRAWFYGKRDSRIEDDLARLEDSASRAIDAIRGGADCSGYTEVLQVFTGLLAFRTRALRDHFIDVGVDLMDRFAESAADGNMERAVKHSLAVELDTHLEEARRRLPPEFRETLDAILAQPHGREILRGGIMAELEAVGIAGLMRSTLGRSAVSQTLSGSVVDGQLRGIQKLLSSGEGPASFAPSVWQTLRCPEPRFVLGDCCVVAQDGAGSFGLLPRFGNTWTQLFLPISSSVVVVASRDTMLRIPTFEVINRASAELSHAYIYSCEDSKTSRELATRIGIGEPFIAKDDIEGLIADVWRDLGADPSDTS